MVERESGLASRPSCPPDLVGIVKPNKPLVVLPVQRQRVTQPVRSLFRNTNFSHFKFHPILTLLVDNQDLTVQAQKRIQTWIASRPILHTTTLSPSDNHYLCVNF